MSKKTESTVQGPTAADRLAALEARKVELTAEVAKLEAEFAALDPLSYETPPKARELRAKLDADRGMLAGLPSEIAKARADADHEAAERRDSEGKALALEEAKLYAEFVAAVQLAREKVAALRDLNLRLRGVGRSSAAPVGDVPAAIESLLAVLRATRPEAVGLPPRPTRDELAKEVAYDTAAQAVRCWERFDELAKKSDSDKVRADALVRADEVGPLISASFERCRELGVDPPSGGPSFVASLSRMLTRARTKTFSERLADLPPEEQARQRRIHPEL